MKTKRTKKEIKEKFSKSEDFYCNSCSEVSKNSKHCRFCEELNPKCEGCDEYLLDGQMVVKGENRHSVCS